MIREKNMVPNKCLDFDTTRHDPGWKIIMNYVRGSKLTILYDQLIDASGYKHMAINLITVR
jgi:hypothetical protein